MKYIIGIDEVGRGPLAGPVTVGAFCIEKKLMRSFFKGGLKNSKALSVRKREEYATYFRKARRDELVDYAICSVSHTYIDKRGIMSALRMAIKRAFRRLNISPNNANILLDGGLRAPKEYANQKTIIKGDTKKPIIAAASIVAKVFRDRKMIRLAKKFPQYGFEIHKGYGTRVHYKTLKKYGPSMLHRHSFITKLLQKP